MNNNSVTYEVETVVGLEALAGRELQEEPFSVALRRQQNGKGFIRFSDSVDPAIFLRLQLAQAVYRVLKFPVARPKALLGHENFQFLVKQIDAIIQHDSRGRFNTLGIDAAGSDSPVMRRLRSELAEAVGLGEATVERGDLLLRVIPAREDGGWECLIRLTPRPLSARAWRIRNFHSALNATVAQAMVRLSEAPPHGAFVNLCCGSGSLLIERARSAPHTAAMVGIDNDMDTLNLARENISAANVGVCLCLGDATSLPLASGCASAIVADLPFGLRSGTHNQNLDLYPRLLAAASRIAAPGARFVTLTHELRLMDRLVESTGDWSFLASHQITLRGLHPRIDVLIRNA